MKTLKSLYFLLLMILCVHLVGCEKDEEKETAQQENNQEAKKENNQKNNSNNGYSYVDLGLSVKWATCNVGAENPWDYGDYFAWGETVGYGKSDPSNAHNKTYTGGNTTKTYYYWNTYKYCSGTSYSTLTKYNTDSDYGTVDNKKTLELTDDAARVNMGGSWRMPTLNEQTELLNNCYWEWTSNYNGKNVSGYIVYKVKSTSDKGKVKNEDETPTIVGSYSLTDVHIFLPAAGYRYKPLLTEAGYNGVYWSSSLRESARDDAYGLYFYSDYVGWDYSYGRCYGQSVRAVVDD